MANIPGTANPDILTGTATADLIEGLASDDVLYGFDGNDRLLGGSGDDILYGGSGDDTLDGGTGEDLFYGQSGLDTVTYASALAALTLNMADNSLSTGDAAGDFYLSIEDFILTTFNDTFVGNAFANQARGGGGDDLLQGFEGNDRLFGDAGNDTLDGGLGVDQLNGGAGLDTASYATSIGQIFIDLVTGDNTGDARFDTFVDIEALMLSSFDDIAQLSTAIRRVNGGGGNDVLTGNNGRDTIEGGADDDTLLGGASNDLLQGDGGDDFLDGGTGDDTLLGGTENDRLTGSAGADVMDGGAGDDLVTYSGKLTVDLATPSSSTGFALGDTFVGVEGIGFLGGTGSRFVGNATALSVLLLGGSMTAIAGSGAESFVATSGSMAVSYVSTPVTGVSFRVVLGQMTGTRGALGDTLDGVRSLTMTGRNDVFDATGFNGLRPLPSTILAGSGSDALTLKHVGTATIDTGGGNDTVTGAMDGGTVALGSGADSVNMVVDGVQSLGAPVLITSGSGDDTVTIETAGALLDIRGEAGNDTILLQDAGFGSYTVDGGDGNDTITTSSLAASVAGGLGNDTLTVTAIEALIGLSGGDGDDVIVAKTQGGTLRGDLGNDTLTLNLFMINGGSVTIDGGDGNDQLTVTSDFTRGQDPLGKTVQVRGGSGDDTVIDNTQPAFAETQTLFVFGVGWGDDTVTGFDDGTDLIRFEGTSGAGLDSFDDLVVSGDGTQTVVSFGADSITLLGLDVALFGVADVAFS